MESAVQNDVKTSHEPKYTYITFTIGFGRWILQSPPLIYALSSVHHTPIYNRVFKNLQKDVGILSALHHHAPKQRPQDRTRSIEPLQALWLSSGVS